MGYQDERAASQARRARAWAEAEQAYTAWFQDLDARAGTLDLGVGHHAQRTIHAGRQLAWGPKCWCGKATLAVGMCSLHYHAWYRARTRHRPAARRGLASLCHPARSHHSDGLCRPCYECLPHVRSSKRRRKMIGRIFAGLGCHHVDRGERPAHHRGMCSPCFHLYHNRKRGRSTGQQIPKIPGLPLKCGHNAREEYALGVCAPCYWRHRYQRDKFGRTRVKLHLVEVGSDLPAAPIGSPALCHPAGKTVAHGLCSGCYKIWRAQSKPPLWPFLEAMQRRAQGDRRRRVARDAVA